MAPVDDEQGRLQRRIAQGKMFRKMSCERCVGRFHFTEIPRVSRVPVCPLGGSFAAREQAA